MEAGIIAEGVPPEQGKFCADCKHLIGVRYATDEAMEKWRCGHPKNIVSEKVNLVTGIKKKIFKIEPIAELRLVQNFDFQEICGLDGKWYEEYKPPERNDPTTTTTQIEPGPSKVIKSGGKKFSMDL